MNRPEVRENIPGEQQHGYIATTHDTTTMGQNQGMQHIGLQSYTAPPPTTQSYRSSLGLHPPTGFYTTGPDYSVISTRQLGASMEGNNLRNLQRRQQQQHMGEYVCPDVALFDSALTAHEYLKSASSWVSDHDDESDEEFDKENQCGGGLYHAHNMDRAESYVDLLQQQNQQDNENDFGLLNPSPAFSDDDMQTETYEIQGY